MSKVNKVKLLSERTSGAPPVIFIPILVNHSHQVAERLLHEQDDKDLVIILGDMPVLKVSFPNIVFP